tara:strand:+ start:10026 stop:10292 length:267 start_codon:yes stop_codon:yes gene_type:complete
MVDSAVAASGPRRLDQDLAQMELTQVVDGMAAILDAIMKAGYLEHFSPEIKESGRLIALLGVCESQAQRACELTRLCEEIWAARANSL